jgi:hypothetical protein
MSFKNLCITALFVFCITMILLLWHHFSIPARGYDGPWMDCSAWNQGTDDRVFCRKARIYQYRLYQNWLLEEQELKPKYQFGSEQERRNR